MAEIALHGKRGRGKVALVDDADLPALQGYRFYLSSHGYPRTFIPRPGAPGATVNLHQLLRDSSGGLYRDHINGNPLDNRRSNLRPCTQEENNRNRPHHRNSRTRLKGVTPFGKRWRAQIHVGKQQHYLGCYAHPMLAAIAYNAAACVLHGSFARLNVIEFTPEILAALSATPPEVPHAAD